MQCLSVWFRSWKYESSELGGRGSIFVSCSCLVGCRETRGDLGLGEACHGPICRPTPVPHNCLFHRWKIRLRGSSAAANRISTCRRRQPIGFKSFFTQIQRDFYKIVADWRKLATKRICKRSTVKPIGIKVNSKTPNCRNKAYSWVRPKNLRLAPLVHLTVIRKINYQFDDDHLQNYWQYFFS